MSIKLFQWDYIEFAMQSHGTYCIELAELFAANQSKKAYTSGSNDCHKANEKRIEGLKQEIKEWAEGNKKSGMSWIPADDLINFIKNLKP